jgi:hypothetical protein
MTTEETAEQKLARLKAKQAEAHKKWRASEKGRAYYQRLKERKALAPEVK